MTRPQPRIDLNHGYMHFIRRNQLDRDEYDKIHEQRKTEIRERLGEKKEVPKPTNLYVPPHLRPNRQVGKTSDRRSFSRSDSDSQDEDKGSQSDSKQKLADDHIRNQVRRRVEKTHATVDDICGALANYSLGPEKPAEKSSDEDLFTLELTLRSGEKQSIGVPRNTQPARLAKAISQEHKFTDSQSRNLRVFIEEQLERRLAREKQSTDPDPSEVPKSPGSEKSDSSCSTTSVSPVPFEA